MKNNLVEYFSSIGINILNLYGMSECCGPLFISTPEEYKLGSCGRVIEGTSVDIDKSGQIVVQGRNVMLGYFKDKEGTTSDTAQYHSSDDRMGSGDLGSIDDDGFLYVLGPSRNVIRDGTRFINPLTIENRIKQIGRLLNDVMVVRLGTNDAFLTALVTLKTEPNEDGSFCEQLTKEAVMLNSNVTVVKQAYNDNIWKRYTKTILYTYNRQTNGSNTEKIQKCTILPVPGFSIRTGDLTPTLQMKRHHIIQKFKHLLNVH